MRSVSESMASSSNSWSSEGDALARMLSSFGEGGGEGIGGVISRGGKIPCLRNASLLDQSQDRIRQRQLFALGAYNSVSSLGFMANAIRQESAHRVRHVSQSW